MSEVQAEASVTRAAFCPSCGTDRKADRGDCNDPWHDTPIGSVAELVDAREFGAGSSAKAAGHAGSNPVAPTFAGTVKYVQEALDLLRRAAAGESVEIGQRQAEALLVAYAEQRELLALHHQEALSKGHCHA